jgi:hypothetical protein
MTTLTKGILEVMALPTAQGRDLYIEGRKAYWGDLKPWDGYLGATACRCGSQRVVRLKDKRAVCRRCGRAR